MEDDWDLHAIVRRCVATSTASSAAANANGYAASVPDLDSVSYFPSFGSMNKDENLISPFPNPFQDLHELYKPFFPKAQLSLSSQSSPMSAALSCFSLSKDQEQTQSQAASLTTATRSASSMNSQPPRSKKRKNQHKRVCHVPADALSSDIWAWRKYGQKPIKGSPYPRGYYRCSSSKGCLARKQVERNKSDPTMFIVTYTAEHNHPAPTHRNSLAGSTRQKPEQPDKTARPANPQPSCSSQSTKTESVEDMLEDEEDGPGFSAMAVSDDLFAGLEDFAAPPSGDCFADLFPANFGVNWAVNSAAAAAGGI